MVFNGKQFKLKAKGQVKECTINESFMVIVSETGNMAEDFVVRVRDELAVNTWIRYFWPSQIEKAYDEVDKAWTRRAFKYNGTFLMGIGQGQQIRGRIKGAARVTFLIGDDIYSEKNTITPENRNKIRLWWNGATKNSVDDVRGKIMLLGTIVHEDTVLVDNYENELWEHYKIKVMPLKKFEQFIKEHLDVDYAGRKCKMKFDEVKDKLTRIKLQREYYDKVQRSKHWGLSWKERIDLYYLALMFKENFKARTIATMYQEYFHEMVYSGHKKFRKEYFQSAGQFRIFNRNGMNWIDWEHSNKPESIYIQIGVDIGGSATGADETVITVSGMLSNYRTIVIKQIIGNFSTRDITRENSSSDARIWRVITDETDIRTIGWQDELFRTALFYNADMIKIGYSGNEKERLYEVGQLFRSNGNYTPIVGRLQSVNEGDKKNRIKRNLETPYQTMMVYHAAGLEQLEYQLEYIDKVRKDDSADSMEVSVNGIRPPEELDYDATTKINEFAELEYQDTARLAGFKKSITRVVGYDPWKGFNRN